MCRSFQHVISISCRKYTFFVGLQLVNFGQRPHHIHTTRMDTFDGRENSNETAFPFGHTYMYRMIKSWDNFSYTWRSCIHLIPNINIQSYCFSHLLGVSKWAHFSCHIYCSNILFSFCSFIKFDDVVTHHSFGQRK